MTAELKPADLLKNLKFDRMSIDTSAAESYVKEHRYKYSDILQSDGYKIVKLNKIINQDDSTVHECFLNVAERIKHYTYLFAQLEYLIRNIDVGEVKEYDIKMIVKCFEYFAKQKVPVGDNHSLLLYFTKNSPLAVLGLVAEMLTNTDKVKIVCDADTVVIATLFAEVYYDIIGKTDAIQLDATKSKYYLDESMSEVYVGDKFIDVANGCVAVVTEKSDIDSVIDTLVGATHNYRYPWHLRRIIVQESVYQTFQRALSQKSQNTLNEGDANLKVMSAQEFTINGKVFVADYVGTDDIRTKPIILVEAYRTTKELLSLLQKYKHNYLSLWCSGLSVSNEIAFGAKALQVAINDYGVFDGSDNFFEIFKAGFNSAWQLQRFKYKNKLLIPNFESFSAAAREVSQLREGWLKTDLSKRFETINKVVVKAKDSKTYEKDLMLKQLKVVSCAEVEKGKLTIGITEPHGVVYIDVPELTLEQDLADILNSIIRGNGVVLNIPYDNDVQALITSLKLENVPIRYVSNNKITYTELVKVSNIDFFIINDRVKLSLYSKKVVWSRFGETFAN